MLGQPCRNCDDMGFLEIDWNSTMTIKPCPVCNRNWSRTARDQVVINSPGNSVIIDQLERESNSMHVNSSQFQNNAFSGKAYQSPHLPSTVTISARSGTALVTTSASNDPDNIWHVSLVVPKGNSELFHLGKDLKKYKDDADMQATGQTSVAKLTLFHKILKQMDNDYPFLDETRYTAPCGCREWRLPVVELAAIEKLAKQLGLTVRIDAYHKAKNCKALKSLAPITPPAASGVFQSRIYG